MKSQTMSDSEDTETTLDPFGEVATVVIADHYVVVHSDSHTDEFPKSAINVADLLEHLPNDVDVVRDGDAV